ncbi:MAG: ECF transporter S component [Ignisphaera sp.]
MSLKEGLGARYRASLIAAFAGIGAAVYYILLWLPGIPVIGLPNIKMEIGASLSPVFGIVLGPYIGFLAVLIGNAIKTFVPTPNIYGIPFLLAAPLSAFGAGMLVKKRWAEVSIVMLAMLIAAMFAPPFYPVTEYWYVYLVAFYDKIAALILTPILMIIVNRISKKQNTFLFYIALYITMFISRELDKAFGCFVFALPQVYRDIFGITKVSKVRSLYLVSPMFYLVEYILEAIVAFAVAIPLIKALTRVPGLSEILHIRYLREWQGSRK